MVEIVKIGEQEIDGWEKEPLHQAARRERGIFDVPFEHEKSTKVEQTSGHLSK